MAILQDWSEPVSPASDSAKSHSISHLSNLFDDIEIEYILTLYSTTASSGRRMS
jgi:hypothetical protein